MPGTFEEEKYRRMVWKDHKSQAIFFENQEKVEKNSSAQPGFWEIKKQYSKDAVLNELCRQDAELEQPGIKHVFRHGGLFDDDYEGDPEGKGTDATDWLRGIEGADSSDLEADDNGDDASDTEDFDGFEEEWFMCNLHINQFSTLDQKVGSRVSRGEIEKLRPPVQQQSGNLWAAIKTFILLNAQLQTVMCTYLSCSWRNQNLPHNWRTLGIAEP